MSNSRTIFSVGYEKASQRDLLQTLIQAGVALIIDIRERPQSRRAGFSKRQLASSADLVGIGYLHLKALGTPPDGRAAHRRHDYDAFWNIYEIQLRSADARAALVDLAERAAAATSCLLCYEADWQTCHRKRVTEMLAERGFHPHHLSIDPGFL